MASTEMQVFSLEISGLPDGGHFQYLDSYSRRAASKMSSKGEDVRGAAGEVPDTVILVEGWDMVGAVRGCTKV